MKQLKKTIPVVLAIIMMSCATVRQGVEGMVTEISGNQMPGPDARKSGASALNTNVLITIALAYDELVKNEHGLYETPMDKLIVHKTKTDSKGYYKALLSPGVYSVLVQTKDGWFANESDENGVLNKITVERKQIVTKHITVNYRAAY